jgi:hypothetical protein
MRKKNINFFHFDRNYAVEWVLMIFITQTKHPTFILFFLIQKYLVIDRNHNYFKSFGKIVLNDLKKTEENIYYQVFIQF